jgi:hypothetical protein
MILSSHDSVSSKVLSADFSVFGCVYPGTRTERSSGGFGGKNDCLAAWAQGRCDAVVSPALLAEYHETIEELRLDGLS